VRSYRTFSPLPILVRRQVLAVYFLWHFPWVRTLQALPGALSDGARTFLCNEYVTAIASPTPTFLDGGFYSKANISIDKSLVNTHDDNSLVNLSKNMPTDRNTQTYEVTWLIRRLFRAMGARADQYLADAELSAADRAVLEFLYPHASMSVPEIARRYDVSRQHIQTTVNALLAKGLLRSIDNPRHKRSRLVRLSSLGRECFEEIRRNEGEEIAELFADISDQSLATTRETLTSLLNQFR